jgi:hypothetical protein
MHDSPGRVTQSRLICGAHGGLAEACLDADKRAWARICLDGDWTPWTQVAGGVIDVDITATPPDGTVFALVIVTRTITRSAGGREVFSLRTDGTLTVATV